MINRPEYIKQLNDFKDTKIIKVITGMRRCGKSYLLNLYIEKLKKEGINEKNIIYFNFDSLKNLEYRDYLKLYNYITEKIDKKTKNYIFLDEIQMVPKWEETVNSLIIDYPDNVDIYITGSNAFLFSSELQTLLSGRYIEIPIYPLSFKEYLSFDKKNNENINEKFNDYLHYGSLPVIFEHEKTESIFNTLLTGIYNTVILKDIIQRKNIKNTVLLENIVRYSLDNIGNLTSSKKISKHLKNKGTNTSVNTILEYYKYLEDAYILYSIERYDIKGKKYLKTLRKYYVVDTGIRNAILGYRNVDIGHILENIVFLELKRKGYTINIGKIDKYEVDFIVSNQNTKKYYQVTESLKDSKVLERECKPLENIKDNYEKIILSMDKSFIKDKNGIKFQNIIEFLLE